MAKPPAYNQKTYRGRIRASMRTLDNHCASLKHWSDVYLAHPADKYPTQLAAPADITLLNNFHAQVVAWLQSRGPIPPR